MVISIGNEREMTVLVVGLVPVAVTMTYCVPAGIGVKNATELPPPHAVIPMLIATSPTSIHSALLSLRWRRRVKKASKPSGTNAMPVEKLKPSGSVAGVETETTILVIAVELLADTVSDGGLIVQVT